MRRRARTAALAALLAEVGTASMAGAVPATVTQEGRLYDAEGQPVTGDLAVKVAIYDTPGGSVPVWSEVQTVSFDDGYFSMELGAMTPLDAAVLGSASLELGIAVEDDPEMTPRARIRSVPYALVCGDVQGEIHPESVWVGGAEVIDENGQWVGDPAGLQGPTGPTGAAGAQGPAGAS